MTFNENLRSPKFKLIEMALQRNKVSEIPADAIRLSEDEALAYQWKIMEDTQDQSNLLV